MYTKRWLQIQFITKPNNPGNILKGTQAGNMQLHDSCYHREKSKKKKKEVYQASFCRIFVKRS